MNKAFRQESDSMRYLLTTEERSPESYMYFIHYRGASVADLFTKTVSP